MPSNGYNTKNSTADAMSEYHRNQAASARSTPLVQGPNTKFGSWDGNKGRKDWYRQEYQADFRESKAKTHDGAKETWYKVRDS